MNRRKLRTLFRDAHDHMRRERPEDLAWVKGVSRSTYRDLTAKDFMTEYAWVVYAAGFRVATLHGKCSALRKAFGMWRLNHIASMRSLAGVLKSFGNERKARCVVRGARLIITEGFPSFKTRIGSEGPDALAKLPGIGDITKNHLARNIGLAPVGKNDIWIARIAKAVKAASWTGMLTYLARRSKLSSGAVDLILWQFCADGAWRKLGYRSFRSYMRSL